MSERKHCDEMSPDEGKKGLCTDCQSSSVDTDNRGNISDTPTLATLDSTSETLKLATLDSTSDSPTTVNLDDSCDTLELAKHDRESQDRWECEYSYGGEADLHRHYNRCNKNPDHKHFIPVDKFSIEDLPEDYRDKDVFGYIQAVSDLTVRVSVNYVSDKRPATVPGSCKPYPGYSDRGQRRMTVGTGCVDLVIVYDDTVTEYCKCKECRVSSSPETKFAIISIATAAHVVFDELEAEHTTCHLFFDRGGTPDSCSGVIALTGMSLYDKDVTEDVCYLNHYTHDLVLADRLEQTLKRMIAGLNNTNRCHKFKQRLDVLDRQPLLAIVSHPHGCSKQISLGRFTMVELFVTKIVSFLYNTATCPGSSGARVRIFGNLKDSNTQFLTGFPSYLVHCGVSDVQPKNNCSTYERDILSEFTSRSFQQLDHPDITKDVFPGMSDPSDLVCLPLVNGTLEDHVCFVEEGDESQHYTACKENSGHQNFIPVEKFSLDNLPPFYRSEEVIGFIKCVSDLTVRVSVKYVSEDRPETVPGTDIPFPWFSERGSHLTRVLTGWVDYAVVFADMKCKCEECKHSPNPKPVASIEIKTAACFIYDKLEAQHTTCDLFFDSGETPDACANVVTLADGRILLNKPQINSGSISFLTHDLDLIHSLQQRIYEYPYYLNKLRTYVKTLKKAEQEPHLHIVVSHPHGCAKQISIGCGSDHANADTEDSWCSHSSILCPGSCGAQVIELMNKLKYPVLE